MSVENGSQDPATAEAQAEEKAAEEAVELEDLYAQDKACGVYYGWHIVAVVFVFHVLHVGGLYSTGVFYNSLIETFGASSAETSIALSLPFTLFTGTAAFVGCLTDYFGHRFTAALGSLLIGVSFIVASFADSIYTVIVSFGGLQGLAICLGWLPGTTILQLYFSRRKALAVGLAVSGSGVGNAIIAPIWLAMIEAYGWRATLQISAGVWSVLGLCVAFMLRLPKGVTESPLPRKRVTLSFCCQGDYFLLFLSSFVFSLGYFVPFVHVFAFATEFAQETAESASVLFTVIGVGSFFGRIISGQGKILLHMIFLYA